MRNRSARQEECTNRVRCSVHARDVEPGEELFKWYGNDKAR